MQAGRPLGLWVVLMMVRQAAEGCAQCSSRLDRLERLLMDQQAQLLDHQAQMDRLKQENQDLKTIVKVLQHESRSSDDQRTETSVHAQRARSDDGGPLQVVVNRLAQDVTHLTGNVQALTNSDATRGSTFVHWGSSSCSSSSQLVYSGVLGGSYYGNSGAAVNALCLTMSPRLQNFPSGIHQFAVLYGGEYQTFVDSHHDKDPVCALCWSPLTSTMMIPGTTICPGGWSVQYHGFLMTGRDVFAAASQYVCVDTRMESRPGTDADKNGYLWFYTKTVCGSLPCGPYENNRLVTCVVCSK